MHILVPIFLGVFMSRCLSSSDSVCLIAWVYYWLRTTLSIFIDHLCLDQTQDLWFSSSLCVIYLCFSSPAWPCVDMLLCIFHLQFLCTSVLSTLNSAVSQDLTRLRYVPLHIDVTAYL